MFSAVLARKHLQMRCFIDSASHFEQLFHRSQALFREKIEKKKIIIFNSRRSRSMKTRWTLTGLSDTDGVGQSTAGC